MTALAVFLHTVLVLTLGPLVTGLVRAASEPLPSLRARLSAFVEPILSLNTGLRAPGSPRPAPIAMLALAAVANLLIPFFSSDAVLGFLGDGFTALLLLVGLSSRAFPPRTSSVLAVAGALWALGTLTGTTDLAQALATPESGPVSWLVFLAMALAAAPAMTPEPSPPDNPDLNHALHRWAHSTWRLGWLGIGAMAFPWGIAIVGWASLATALAFFLVKLAVLGGMLAWANARWPKLPLAEAGLACALLALGLVKLGV
jgi:hypothetical protein